MKFCTQAFQKKFDDIGEGFENRCNESYAVLNGATEILSTFSGCLS